ncbi:MAG TPA: hypothetical protein VLV54_06590 [Thermoanaerobaculia bacterium]|nr:hypothetical protein [Thermoanaerobaculia bacterium]
MIRVSFDPEQLPADKKAEWDAWLQKSEAATAAVIDAWETWKETAQPGDKFKADFDEAVWGELKNWLLENVFHGKCAYCETPKNRSQFHAEHFRPKGRVTYRTGGRKTLKRGTCKDASGQTIEHPGYFWLAYHWWNLLPSCPLCNAVEGKKDQFPIAAPTGHILLHPVAQGTQTSWRGQPRPSKRWQGFYYLDPRDLDSLESPLLLHPYSDEEPSEHLVFAFDGSVSAREGSAKGVNSIEVFDLNASDLRTARQQAQEAACNAFVLALGQFGADPESRAAAAQVIEDKFTSQKSAYSSAVRDHLLLFRKVIGRS